MVKHFFMVDLMVEMPSTNDSEALKYCPTVITVILHVHLYSCPAATASSIQISWAAACSIGDSC